jgi:multidrug resistance efflux pump
MLLVVVVTVVYAIFVRLVFFKFKLLRLTPAWGVVTAFVFLHLVLVPLVGMRFIAPVSEDLRVVRPTVQLIPRLPEPTLVEQVLVTENTPVKKGDPLFVFDKRLYQLQVNQAEATLAAAKQNVDILQADVDVAAQAISRTRAKLNYDRLQEGRFLDLAAQRAAPQEQAQEWTARVAESEAAAAAAVAQWQRAKAAFDSQLPNGVNTAVAEAQAQLEQAQFYLDQTVITAPADGMIINLQVREGMVAGIIRAGAIASFIVDEPYILAAYRQENLRFIEPGQTAVVALNKYPGAHFSGKVEQIWWASGRGQFLPSGDLPVFPDGPSPEVRFPIRISLDDSTVHLPIGAEGASLVLTNPDSPFAWFGQIALRAYTWSRWLYPMPF